MINNSIAKNFSYLYIKDCINVFTLLSLIESVILRYILKKFITVDKKLIELNIVNQTPIFSAG